MKTYKFSDSDIPCYYINANTFAGGLKRARYIFQIRGRLRIKRRMFFDIDAREYQLDDSAAYSSENYRFTLQEIKI
jgi:hypothetical protein